MEIQLLDYLGDPTMVDIGESDHVVIDVLSGDMVMTYPFYRDSSNCRNSDFYDGSATIYKKDFDKLNELKKSYDIFNIAEEEQVEYSAMELLNQIAQCV